MLFPLFPIGVGRRAAEASLILLACEAGSMTSSGCPSSVTPKSAISKSSNSSSSSAAFAIPTHP